MFATQDEFLVNLMGYAVVVTYMIEHDMDLNDDEDVKDALVIVAMDETHFSDEELDEGLEQVRFFQKSIRGN